jgi:multicomponent K+:H+ antiporter subunit A
VVILVTIMVVGVAAFMSGQHAPWPRPLLPVNLPAAVAFAALVVTCVAVVMTHGNRLLSLILTSIVGLGVSLAFVQFPAPDLALTQISVEVVTTVLLLLALTFCPAPRSTSARPAHRISDGLVAAISGAGIGALAYAVMTRDFTSISEYHLAQSKPGGGGTNVVNVILVDFRGFDTFGEIIVLCIAALAIYALLDTALKGKAAARLGEMRQGDEAADAHPLMLGCCYPCPAAARAHGRRLHLPPRPQSAGGRLHRRPRCSPSPC